MNSTGVIIIPDIHGRTFWKEAVRDCGGNPVVFLGDYLDPYPSEGISQQSAWENFMEIIAFKQSMPAQVHLLLGNHDLGYMDPLINRSRRDQTNAGRNRNYLKSNLSLFDLAYEAEVGGLRCLLTHAGVNRKWVEYHFGKDAEVSADLFNSMLHGEDYGRLERALANNSEYRGGSWPFSSIVWTDLQEFEEEGTDVPGVIQIFGHTQQTDGPVSLKEGKLLCVDCRRAFVLNEDGLTDIA